MCPVEYGHIVVLCKYLGSSRTTVPRSYYVPYTTDSELPAVSFFYFSFAFLSLSILGSSALLPCSSGDAVAGNLAY